TARRGRGRFPRRARPVRRRRGLVDLPSRRPQGDRGDRAGARPAGARPRRDLALAARRRQHVLGLGAARPAGDHRPPSPRAQRTRRAACPRPGLRRRTRPAPLVTASLTLIARVAVDRLAELAVARSHLAWARRHGGVESGAAHYPWLVLAHAGLLVAAPL